MTNESNQDMQHRATLKFTEQLVERAVRHFWLRTMGYGELFIIILMAALLAWRLADGDRSWMVGVLVTLLFLSIAIPLAIYFGHYRNSLGKFRALKQPVAEFVADDDGFSLTSDLGSTTLKWGAVTEIWRFDSLWLMLFSKSQFVTIPLEDFPEPMRNFVLERVGTAGGKVDG